MTRKEKAEKIIEITKKYLLKGYTFERIEELITELGFSFGNSFEVYLSRYSEKFQDIGFIREVNGK